MNDTDESMVILTTSEQYQVFFMFFEYLLSSKQECRYLKELKSQSKHTKDNHKHSGYQTVTDVIYSPYSPDLLRVSFEWSTTKKGFRYWSKCDESWLEYYYNAVGFNEVHAENIVMFVVFLGFLIEGGYHKAFFKQCRKTAKAKGMSISELIKGMIYTEEQSEWLMTLFVWCDSKKGEQYWMDVNALWIEYLNE